MKWNVEIEKKIYKTKQNKNVADMAKPTCWWPVVRTGCCRCAALHLQTVASETHHNWCSMSRIRLSSTGSVAQARVSDLKRGHAGGFQPDIYVCARIQRTAEKWEATNSHNEAILYTTHGRVAGFSIQFSRLTILFPGITHLCVINRLQIFTNQNNCNFYSNRCQKDASTTRNQAK